MIRITTLLWIALLVVAGGTVMRVSYQVRHVEKHLADLGRATRQEDLAIRVLGAEWDTLNDPQRIDDLAKRHLSLERTPVQRVVSLADIPLKPADDGSAHLLASAIDKQGAARLAAKTVKPPVRVIKAAAPVINVRFAPQATSRPSSPIVAAASVPSPPATNAALTGPALTGPSLTGIGLILARAERHE